MGWHLYDGTKVVQTMVKRGHRFVQAQ